MPGQEGTIVGLAARGVRGCACRVPFNGYLMPGPASLLPSTMNQVQLPRETTALGQGRCPGEACCRCWHAHPPSLCAAAIQLSSLLQCRCLGDVPLPEGPPCTAPTAGVQQHAALRLPLLLSAAAAANGLRNNESVTCVWCSGR